MDSSASISSSSPSLSHKLSSLRNDPRPVHSLFSSSPSFSSSSYIREIRCVNYSPSWEGTFGLWLFHRLSWRTSYFFILWISLRLFTLCVRCSLLKEEEEEEEVYIKKDLRSRGRRTWRDRLMDRRCVNRSRAERIAATVKNHEREVFLIQWEWRWRCSLGTESKYTRKENRDQEIEWNGGQK